MAACVLRIELDAPTTVRVGGEPVSGTVVVTTTGTVNKVQLEVISCWSTHGRGNIDTGQVDQSVLYEGEWSTVGEYRYPFTLKTAVWPPTYYGTYLNVGHYVRARAKVPWAKDPKAEAEFTVAAASAPEDLKPTVAAKPKRSNVLIGWIIGLVFLVVFGALFSILLLMLVPIIAVVGGGYWFFRVFLPRQLTGPVECTAEPTRLKPGETLQGRLRFTPKRNLRIGGIRWTVTSTEKCVSGSGTNKTTHTHELYRKSDQLAEERLLPLGEPQSFDFSFAVPKESPPSLKFSDNDLIWAGELRIDIPKWPDWVKSFALTVVPSADSIANAATRAGDSPTTPASEDAWFDEVLEQVMQSSTDPGRMNKVLEAVRDQVFSIRVNLIEPQDEAPASMRREPGKWMLAYYPPQDEELCLFWPASVGLPPQVMTGWRGQATVVGYDADLGCLLMRVVSR